MVLYRQPFSPAHPVTTSTFFTDFADYLETLILSSEPLVITGDFNVQVDNSNYPDATKLLDLLDWFGFCQYVTQSTHELGHTIDLTITRQSDSIIQGSPTTDHLFSDHLTVLTTLRATKPAPHQRSGCYNKTLTHVLDRHAPRQRKIILQRLRVPWYSDQILAVKRIRRKAERT